MNITKDEIVHDTINQLAAHSTDMGNLERVTTIENVDVIPAIDKDNNMVAVPIGMIGGYATADDGSIARLEAADARIQSNMAQSVSALNALVGANSAAVADMEQRLDGLATKSELAAVADMEQRNLASVNQWRGDISNVTCVSSINAETTDTAVRIIPAAVNIGDGQSVDVPVIEIPTATPTSIGLMSAEQAKSISDHSDALRGLNWRVNNLETAISQGNNCCGSNHHSPTLPNEQIDAINRDIADIRSAHNQDAINIRASVDELGVNLQSANSSLQTLANNMLTTSERIDEVGAAQSDLNGRVGVLTSDVSDIRSDVDALRGIINAPCDCPNDANLNEAVMAIRVGLSTVQADVNSAQSDLVNVHGDISGVNSRIDTINNKTEELKSAIDLVKAVADDAKTKADTADDAIAKISRVKNRVNELAERADTFDARLDAVSDKFTDVNDRIGSVRESVGELKGKMEGSAARVESVFNHIGEVENRVEGVAARFDSINTRIDGIGLRVDSVLNNTNGMDARIVAATSRIEGVSERIDGVRRDVSDMDVRVRHITATVEELARKQEIGIGSSPEINAKIAALQGAVDNSNNEISILHDAVANGQESINSIQSDIDHIGSKIAVASLESDGLVSSQQVEQLVYNTEAISEIKSEIGSNLDGRLAMIEGKTAMIDTIRYDLNSACGKLNNILSDNRVLTNPYISHGSANVQIGASYRQPSGNSYTTSQPLNAVNSTTAGCVSAAQYNDWTAKMNKIAGLESKIAEFNNKEVDALKATIAQHELALKNLHQEYWQANQVYGIEWDVNVSDPAVKRIGNMDLHRSLPVQSGMRGCLLDDSGNVVEYLPADNWTSSVRDGSRGQVMVEIPTHYRKFETEGDIRRVWLSMVPIEGFHEVPKVYMSAYEAALQRSTNKLCSVVNTSTDYRGGDNTASWDSDTAKSLLGKPVTNLSRTQFRTAARNRKQGSASWNMMVYDVYKTLYWLFVVEYATRNSQAPFNAQLTAEGFRQGGLGAGVTEFGITWFSFNSGRPYIPCGYTDEFGNNCGIKNKQVSGYSNNNYVPRYRGIENPFGHIGKIADGINNQCGQICICDNPAKFSDNNDDMYTAVGKLIDRMYDGYLQDIIFGQYGDILGEKFSGNSSSYYCDTQRGCKSINCDAVYFGGFCSYGSAAGLSSAGVNFYLSSADLGIGTRLCYIPESSFRDLE